jgi:peroxiredoxin
VIVPFGLDQAADSPAAETGPACRACYNHPVQPNEPAPDFELSDLNGEPVRLQDLRGKIVILNFWSCECPHSERTDRQIMAMFVQWQDDVELLSVASNSIETPEAMAQAAWNRRLPHVLTDEDHAVADLYGALTTPHVFVIDRDGILRYAGAVDDVSFRQRRPTRFYLDEAVEALLDGRLPAVAETPAYGCTIVREAVE